MSTRTQVKIVGGKFGTSTTLYHHTDGYPTYMLELFAKAWELAKKDDWKKNNSRAVPSFIIASDPGVFEVEKGHQLHGDIEWYYKIHPGRMDGIHPDKEGEWTVDVYKVPFDSHKPVPVIEGIKVTTAVLHAQEIETLGENGKRVKI